MIFKVLLFFVIFLIYHLLKVDNVLAWGPAIHTVLGFRILTETDQILPAIAIILRSFPLEYLYGSLAADFFIGKGAKNKKGHPHNWETGFKMLAEAKDHREAAYACGFLSHLAADVVAHNYFIPNLILTASSSKRMGHLYWETMADHVVNPDYIRTARDLLSMDHLSCDHLLRAAAGKRSRAIKARRQLFTQSVKFSDFLCQSQQKLNVVMGIRYRISTEYLAKMINLSFSVVKDFLKHPESSPCLEHDPIGSRNLRKAGRGAILLKLFNVPRRPVARFKVDKGLLNIK